MIRKGFYFSSKTEKNKGDRDFKLDCWAVGRAKLLKYPEQVPL